MDCARALCNSSGLSFVRFVDASRDMCNSGFTSEPHWHYQWDTGRYRQGRTSYETAIAAVCGITGTSLGCNLCDQHQFFSPALGICSDCPAKTRTLKLGGIGVEACTVESVSPLAEFRHIPNASMCASMFYTKLEYVTLESCAKRCQFSEKCRSFDFELPACFGTMLGICSLATDTEETALPHAFFQRRDSTSRRHFKKLEARSAVAEFTIAPGDFLRKVRDISVIGLPTIGGGFAVSCGDGDILATAAQPMSAESCATACLERGSRCEGFSSGKQARAGLCRLYSNSSPLNSSVAIDCDSNGTG